MAYLKTKQKWRTLYILPKRPHPDTDSNSNIVEKTTSFSSFLVLKSKKNLL